MAKVLVLGAGLTGLATAALLARDGHAVTVVERDPAPAPPPGQAWDGWPRQGVNQFRLAHFMLPRWWSLVRAELPGVTEALLAAGALRCNLLALLPERRRGPIRPADDRFETVTARRPLLEAVLSRAAESAGVTISRGVAVTGLATDGHGAVPRVIGVLTAAGPPIHADLVVDCGGRRSALPAWLVAAGARPPVEEREPCGFVYYGRHFHGELPEMHTNVLQAYDSLSVLTLPGDNGTWSVVLVTHGRDKAMRALRDPACWHQVLARYPLAAHWADGAPITGVDVMAGIEDRHRRLAVAGTPVATGVVTVGDAWACTNPSLGRGASIGLLHALLLRDTLREIDPAEHDKLASRFDELTARAMEPLHQATVWLDRHRLAELEADLAGEPYRPDDGRWAASKALFAASLHDPELTRAYSALASFIAGPDEVFAEPGVRERVGRLSAGAPPYPLPGPSRAELLSTLDQAGAAGWPG
ncbi:FAD-dependent oxidoreductase [Asanoa sp. NPDC050611]|uniref:FAD-dependent oxidoreductase n=1 Tax=Asanoa sp. NPDC050611 TaxID=3157098 RepID=UPI0034086513